MINHAQSRARAFLALALATVAMMTTGTSTSAVAAGFGTPVRMPGSNGTEPGIDIGPEDEGRPATSVSYAHAVIDHSSWVEYRCWEEWVTGADAAAARFFREERSDGSIGTAHWAIGRGQSSAGAGASILWNSTRVESGQQWSWHVSGEVFSRFWIRAGAEIYLAWAGWDALVSCEISVNGIPLDVHTLPGASARTLRHGDFSGGISFDVGAPNVSSGVGILSKHQRKTDGFLFAVLRAHRFSIDGGLEIYGPDGEHYVDDGKGWIFVGQTTSGEWAYHVNGAAGSAVALWLVEISA